MVRCQLLFFHRILKSRKLKPNSVLNEHIIAESLIDAVTLSTEMRSHIRITPDAPSCLLKMCVMPRGTIGDFTSTWIAQPDSFPDTDPTCSSIDQCG
jgi:hypothetical protein